jgi:Glycosyl hydrolase family 10
MRTRLWLLLTSAFGLLLTLQAGTAVRRDGVNAGRLPLEVMSGSVNAAPQWQPARSFTDITFTSVYTLFMPLSGVCSPPPSLSPGDAMVVRDASLYAGPGNTGYDIVAQLKACTPVSPTAVYGDFFAVAARIAGQLQNGFLHKSVLSAVPPNLPTLSQNQVPWQNHDIANHFALNPDVFRQGDGVVVDNSPHDYYNDDLPLSVTLTSAFKLTFQLSSAALQYGSIKLTDQPNNSTGDWWRDIRRVDFSTYNGRLQVDLRDGIALSSTTTIVLNALDNQVVTVTFLDPQGKVFVITDQNNHELRRIDVTQLTAVHLPQGLFPHTAYAGRVAAPFDTLTIQPLTMRLAPPGVWQTPRPVLAEPTLRHQVEARGISMGTEFSWWKMRNPGYWDTMFGAYDTAILSEFSSNTFWRGRGDYDFAALDRIVDWAIGNGLRVRASHLVWGAMESHAIPDWLLNGQFNRDDYIQILHEHVNMVVSHFKGRVTEWSIANEATSRSFSPGADFWGDKIGPDYIEMAFRWARAADPSGILIFNDDNNQSLFDPSTQPVASKMLSTRDDVN